MRHGLFFRWKLAVLAVAVALTAVGCGSSSDSDTGSSGQGSVSGADLSAPAGPDPDSPGPQDDGGATTGTAPPPDPGLPGGDPGPDDPGPDPGTGQGGGSGSGGGGSGGGGGGSGGGGGERSHEITFGGPRLNGAYPAVFGRFVEWVDVADPSQSPPGLTSDRQCSAYGNPSAVDVTIEQITVTGAFSRDPVPDPTPDPGPEGSYWCGVYFDNSTPPPTMDQVCASGLVLPAGSPELCRLGLVFTGVADSSTDYEGLLTVRVSTVCTAAASEVCAEAASLSPTPSSPVTVFWTAETVSLTACLATGLDLTDNDVEVCNG